MILLGQVVSVLLGENPETCSDLDGLSGFDGNRAGFLFSVRDLIRVCHGSCVPILMMGFCLFYTPISFSASV